MSCERSDAELVHLARQGRRDSFAVLIERHYAALRSACRRVLGATEPASDAAQQATLTALVGLDRLRDDERFGSWLIGIGLNVCRSMLRDGARQPHALEAVPDGGPAVDDPAAAAEVAEIEARVRAAIADLPRGQQEAVALFYLAGLTQVEIAERLGTAPGAIKTRLHKARRSLRESLNELWKEYFAMITENTALVPMHVADLRRIGGPDLDSARNIVFLEDDAGSRRLPIWIGAPEASASALTIRSMAASTRFRTPTSKVRTFSLMSASSGITFSLVPA